MAMLDFGIFDDRPDMPLSFPAYKPRSSTNPKPSLLVVFRPQGVALWQPHARSPRDASSRSRGRSISPTPRSKANYRPAGVNVKRRHHSNPLTVAWRY